MKKITSVVLSAAILVSSVISAIPASADQPALWQHGGGPHGGPEGHPGGHEWHHDGPRGDRFAGGPGPHGGFGGPHGDPGRPEGGFNGPWGGHHWHGHHPGGDFAWRGHRFAPGRPFPPGFYGPQYRVDDWQRRGLPEPPHGHRWSYIDGNYVLVAVATGVITSIILNNAFH